MKMKMKGFSNPRVCCRFKFEFLNLPKRLREFSVEASERHFSRISWSNSVQYRPEFLQVFQACSNYKCFNITHNSCFCQIHMTLLHGNLLWLIKHQWNYFYTLTHLRRQPAPLYFFLTRASFLPLEHPPPSSSGLLLSSLLLLLCHNTFQGISHLVSLTGPFSADWLGTTISMALPVLPSLTATLNLFIYLRQSLINQRPMPCAR